jgi:outer membrane lipoprotein carrier protein
MRRSKLPPVLVPSGRSSASVRWTALVSRLALGMLAGYGVVYALGEGVSRAQASPAAPMASDVQAVVDQVQAFYDKARTFQSDFHQEFLVKAYNQTKTSRGHVAFSKPGKMNWTYDEPAGNRVVSDGATVWVYQAADKQMYESPINQSQYPAAVSFLTGTGKLGDAFNFTLRDGDDPAQKKTALGFPHGWVLLGTPKAATPSYQKVLFYVDKATSQVLRVLILDGQGNTNTFTFDAPRVNDPIAPGQFSFTPPPGTNIVRP